MDQLYFSNSEIDIFETGFVFKRFEKSLFIPFKSVKKIRLVVKKNHMVSRVSVSVGFFCLCVAYFFYGITLGVVLSIFFGVVSILFAFIHPFKTRKIRIRSRVFVGEFKIAKSDVEDYKDAFRVIVKVLKTKEKKAIGSIAYMDL